MKLTLLALLALTTAHAGVVGFSSNPTGNSTDFANAVAAQLGVIGDVSLTVDYEAHPVGALQSNFYGGFTISFSTSAIVTTSLSAGGDTSAGPVSSGEGVATSTQRIFPGAAAFVMEVTFINPILGFGFYVIDHYNPASGGNTATLSAYSGPNGTGTLLGSVDAPVYNFQNNNKYFLGILSTDSDIRSIRFTASGTAGDGLYIDDLELAEGPAIPEPGTWLFCASALALVTIARRR